MVQQPFNGYLVRQDEQGTVAGSVEQLTVDNLPTGEVLIRVAYSSLNYKDALAATGHPGVVKQLPHIPGIDAAGTVAASDADEYSPGDQVLVTGYGMGANRFGGWAQYVRVPTDYVVPLPEGLSLRESMIYGTAGFTAAQSVMAVEQVDPARGPVVVTGASGGVGSLAVALLSKSGYEVVAVTGKPAARPLLERLGARQVIGREEVDDCSDRPLLKARWSAAVDTVGGNLLASVLRSTDHRGVVTACGLVAGAELAMTVYPFILRGVRLIGIDSAMCPRPERLAVWQRLAGPWKLSDLEPLVQTVGLDELDRQVQKILAGQVCGRTLVVPEAPICSSTEF